MQGHDADLCIGIRLLVIHDQADMFEKALKVFKRFQCLDQLFQVFQPPRRLGRLVVLPHRRIAGFVKNDLGQFRVRCLGRT